MKDPFAYGRSSHQEKKKKKGIKYRSFKGKIIRRRERCFLAPGEAAEHVALYREKGSRKTFSPSYQGREVQVLRAHSLRAVFKGRGGVRIREEKGGGGE